MNTEVPKIEVPKFNLQQFARDAIDLRFRGRNRLSGNWGRLFINGVMIFELSAFECKVTADRDDVIIGQSKDSKIVSLTGEGSFTIKQVFTRGYDKLFNNWKEGYDERFIFVGVIRDPDTYLHQQERIRIENVAISSLEILKFSKGEVVEKTVDFTFTPEDLHFENSIEIPDQSIVHESGGMW